MSGAVMHEAGKEAGGSPFSRRSVLGLVVIGAALFIALLWMMGAGMMSGSTNNGGSHVGGKGLNGYAALAGFLEKRGFEVHRFRIETSLNDPGLLVLTPPQSADGEQLRKILVERRYEGPTLIITPKWAAVPIPENTPGTKKGWVHLNNTQSPVWKGFLDDVSVSISPVGSGKKPAHWAGSGAQGQLPDANLVMSGTGDRLVPLVVGKQDGRILAAYIDDGGYYPALEDMALQPPPSGGDDEEAEGMYPIVLIFEQDLLDNYGMAEAENAVLAEQIIRAAIDDSDDVVNFDLTLNGFGRSANLLTLAFTPPFLAATLCLLMAALAVGWRAFLRFGPPRKSSRAIAFGKRTLVANAAGLIRRTRRLHLIAGPYAARLRGRLVRTLALQRLADSDAMDSAIDRAIAARDPSAEPFSTLAARLRAARRPRDVLTAAQDLHALERKLTR